MRFPLLPVHRHVYTGPQPSVEELCDGGKPRSVVNLTILERFWKDLAKLLRQAKRLQEEAPCKFLVPTGGKEGSYRVRVNSNATAGPTTLVELTLPLPVDSRFRGNGRMRGTRRVAQPVFAHEALPRTLARSEGRSVRRSPT